MNIIEDLKQKFTMLQDDFGEEDAPDEATNSDAPEETLVVEEEEDAGSEAVEHDEGHHEEDHSAPTECEFSLFGDCEAFTYWRLVQQVLNVASFALCILLHFSAPYFMPYTREEITSIYDLPIDPAEYTYDIWYMIYGSLAMFVWWQMLPVGWIEHLGGSRNDGMLFNWLPFIFMISMLLQPAWLICWLSNDFVAHMTAWLLLNGLFWAVMPILTTADRTPMWWLEAMITRVPFSIYGGWLTFEIVQTFFYFVVLILFAFTDSVFINGMIYNKEGNDPINEEMTTVAAMWLTFFWFTAYMWFERNPIYGLVLIWVTTGIIEKNMDKDKGNNVLVANLGMIDSLQTISVILLTVYLVFEEVQPWYEPISWWKGGLFGMVDWSLFFTQMKQLLTYPEEFLQNEVSMREFVN